MILAKFWQNQRKKHDRLAHFEANLLIFLKLAKGVEPPTC